MSDLDDTYRRAGFSGRFRMGTRPALVVVDLSLGFTDRSSPLGSDLDSVIEHTARLCDIVRACGGTVVFTTLAYDENMHDAGVWVQKVPSLSTLVQGTRSTTIDPRLGVQPTDTVLQKRYPSAFAGTHLGSLLTSRNVDTAIVAGATTSGCVRATVVDALQYGYVTVVPRECVGDRAPEPHEASLFDIDAKYGDVLSIDAVTEHLAHLTPASPR